MNLPLKSGVSTSEFWLTAIGGLVLTALSCMSLLDATWAATGITLLGLGYQAVRAKLKSAQAQSALEAQRAKLRSGTSILLALLLSACLLLPSCAFKGDDWRELGKVLARGAADIAKAYAAEQITTQEFDDQVKGLGLTLAGSALEKLADDGKLSQHDARALGVEAGREALTIAREHILDSDDGFTEAQLKTLTLIVADTAVQRAEEALEATTSTK